MRYKLSKPARKAVFEKLKEEHGCVTLRDLARSLAIPFKTLEKYRYGERHIPESLLQGYTFEIIEEKPDNWGQVKGGKRGGRTLAKRGKQHFISLGRKGNARARRIHGKEFTEKAVAGRIAKRALRSERIMRRHQHFFTNKNVTLDPEKIVYSAPDREKHLRFPQSIEEELAEEIGVHLGDGCLLKERHYFSVKVSKKEHEYVEYLRKLYRQLYNIDISIRKMKSVIGFEIYSKALFTFKHHVVDVPHGKKTNAITVPECILKTKNRQIYCAFIRGLFDTDGCIHLRHGRYPVIIITIKSEKLIKELGIMLKRLGFIPAVEKYQVVLNGTTMARKWLEEIGSSNPVKHRKLKGV